MSFDTPTPEGQAFSDYVESINCNPYPYETEDHARYAKAYNLLFESQREKMVAKCNYMFEECLR